LRNWSTRCLSLWLRNGTAPKGLVKIFHIQVE
jgi:hypothetical protein